MPAMIPHPHAWEKAVGWTFTRRSWRRSRPVPPTRSRWPCNVDDADAHCERARAAGAVIATEPATQDYGEGYWADRGYEARDLEGHHWWFMQRLR